MTEANSASRDEPDGPSMFRRRMAAIMAADVAGYSRLLATGEEDALQLFHQCRNVFDAEVARYGGRIFNTAGDSVMSEFASAVEAVRAAIAIQHALEVVNQPWPADRRVRFRIGVTIGDVIERDGDLLGDGVNIAARLESVAQPGGVCVSRSVHDAVAGKVSASFRSIGPQTLKNIPAPVEAFTVAFSAVADAPAKPTETARRVSRSGRGDPERAARRRRRWARIILIVLAFTVVVPTVRHAKRLLETQLGLKLPAPPKEQAEKAPPPQRAASVQPGAGSPDVAAGARELYQKGRALEAGGDVAGARTAYVETARAGAGFIDPLLRLAALARLQDGPAAARRLFADLAAVSPDPAVQMVYAQQLGLTEQATRLRRLLDATPAFAPAWYALALALNDSRAGHETLTRLRTEHAALDQFLTASRTGALTRFFIDSAVLQEWVEQARRRVAEIDAAFGNRETRPVLSYQASPSHWTVNIALPEDAIAVQYRLGDRGGFSRADLRLSGDGKTARAAAFTMPARAGKTKIYVSYVDTAGLTAGPFVYHFDASEISSERQRSILMTTSGSWLTWATDRDEIYFPYLLTYRCAIRSAHVGFDGAAPDIALPLPTEGCADNAPPPPGAQNSLPAPHDARSVSIKLVLQNGETPPPVTISRDP